MLRRVLPLHKVPGSLITETISDTKLSEGNLCHPHPFQPEVCVVVVIRPKELKNRPSIPFYPTLLCVWRWLLPLTSP